MLTIALDTTADTASVAAVNNGRVLGVFTVNGRLTHSETMLPMLERLLECLAIKPENVELYAVTEGPGSFTGVRIGVAMVKGLAFASGKPCVGVSSLESLARNLDGLDGTVVPVMDARRSQVYCAIFSHGKRLLDDSLLPLSELAERLKDISEPLYFVGDGCDLATDYFKADGRVKPTPADRIYHNAASCALLAEETYLASEDKEAFTDRSLSPRYLRESQAERERRLKMNL